MLIYRLAEHRIRQRLAETGETVPNQVQKPIQHPTMRWLFQCFGGVSLVLLSHAEHPTLMEITGMTALHAHILRLLGPLYEKLYEVSN